MATSSFKIALTVLTALLLIPASYAQSPEAEIQSLSINPSSPSIFDRGTVTIEVVRLVDGFDSYRLELNLVKDGEIKLTSPFTFALQKDLVNTITFPVIPEEVGEFELVVRLMNEEGTETKDTEILTFDVLSDIGPFDVILDSPSNVVAPGGRTPLVVSMVNMGEKSTDVKVKLTMDCHSVQDISKEFFVFLGSGNTLDKTFDLDVCDEPGIHEITASIIYLNTTWISAVSQVVVDEFDGDIEFIVPESVTVAPGQSTVFDVKVTNLGPTSIDNLRFLTSRLPEEWVDIKPARVGRLDPQESVIFIVNITPPKDALASDTIVSMSAAADQIVESQNSDLNVILFQSDQPVDFIPVDLEADVPDFLIEGETFFSVIAVVAVLGVVIFLMYLKRRSDESERWKNLYGRVWAKVEGTIKRDEDDIKKSYKFLQEVEKKRKKYKYKPQ